MKNITLHTCNATSNNISSIAHVQNNHSNKRHFILVASHSKIHTQTRLQLEKVFNLYFDIDSLKWYICKSVLNYNEDLDQYIKNT